MKINCLNLTSVYGTILKLNKRKEKKNWIDLVSICYNKVMTDSFKLKLAKLKKTVGNNSYFLKKTYQIQIIIYQNRSKILKEIMTRSFLAKFEAFSLHFY